MRLPTYVAAIGFVLFSSAAFSDDTVFIESANALDLYLSLQSPPVLGTISSGTEKSDGRIVWHRALDGEKGILFASFESGQEAGLYLRCKGNSLVLESDDGTAQFAKDASFKVSFNSGGSLTLESIAQPGYFVRHRGVAVTLEQSDHTAAFEDDASFFRVAFDKR